MVDVFVSYARKDQERCKEIASRLEGLKLDVWFDRYLQSGIEFPSELEEKLHSAACVLVLWSEHSVRSDWVQREAAIGRSESKLCSVRLDNSDLPASFSEIHTLDLPLSGFSWGNEAWMRVLDRIGSLVHRRGLVHISQAVALGESLPSARGIFECKTIAELRLDTAKEWESRRIASRLVSLDYAAYEDLTERDEGSISHWEAIIDFTPESWVQLTCARLFGPRIN